MERKVLVVCSVVGLLGILSAVTGFVAEATRIKVIFSFISACNPSLVFFRLFFLTLDFTCIWVSVFGFLLYFSTVLLADEINEENGGGKFFFLFRSFVNFRWQCILLE